jgi:hypothetical protein
MADVVSMARRRVEKRLAMLEARRNSDIVMSKAEWNQNEYLIKLCKQALRIGDGIDQRIQVVKATKEKNSGQIVIH